MFLAQTQFRHFNAFRQLDVGHMHDVANVEVRQIDFDELRKILRQHRDFQFGDRVRDQHARLLAGRRGFLIEEVQRHADADRLVLVDALEIQMQKLRLERMALHVTQQHALGRAVELQIENGRVEPFVLRRKPRGVVVELDARRVHIVAVNNCRHFGCATQAAARTFAFVFAALGRNFVSGCHVDCLG